MNREQHFSDAGIYRIAPDKALVQTVDFFTPIVDDPYIFGQIAAANALSDVYAMGGKPLTALNIICFPVSCHPLEIMESILRGGYDKVNEAEAVVVGGHSVEDPEPKYGLAVTGLVDPEKLINGSGARPGDCLILTKPLGTGIIATALKGEMLKENEAAEAISGMTALNAGASAAMMEAGASACTDVTGFSFLGHLHEMLLSSGVGAEIEYSKVPLYKGVKAMVAVGMIPAGAYRNLEYIQSSLEWQGPEDQRDDALIILADPQTSGGLLISTAEEKLELLQNAFGRQNQSWHIVGRITEDPAGRILLR